MENRRASTSDEVFDGGEAEAVDTTTSRADELHANGTTKASDKSR